MPAAVLFPLYRHVGEVAARARRRQRLRNAVQLVVFLRCVGRSKGECCHALANLSVGERFCSIISKRCVRTIESHVDL
jgi:hypothetical protein